MRVEDPTLRPCTDHATVVADRYQLGPVLRRSPGCCAHRGYDDLLQRTVTVTLLAGRGPLVLPPRSWLDRGPEVADLFDAGDVDDRLFLVTQHPPEPTLAETTPPGGLDARQVRALGAAVADTLAPRHRHGSAHGGLGAGTVAWTPQGASLAEFGLLPWLERSGELPVAPPFPAPEREAGARHDAAGDVYALGRLLDELAPAHRRRALRDLLAEMTADSPADRPTMDEVARRLSGAREPGRRRAPLARSAAMVAAACCLVVLGVGSSALAGSAPSAPGATLATTAAAPVRPAAPLLAPPVDQLDTAGSAGRSAPDETVLAKSPDPVPTTTRVEPTSEARTRAAMRRDDHDRPTTTSRPGPTSTKAGEPTETGKPTEPSGTSRPTETSEPEASDTTGSPDPSTTPTRPTSGQDGLRDVLDHVTAPLRHDDTSRADRTGDRNDPSDEDPERRS